MTTTTRNLSGFRRFGLRSSWLTTTLLVVFLAVLAWLGLNALVGGRCQGECVVNTLGQMLRSATPIAFAAFTGLMCERAGIINIGIEGQMLVSAMVCYAVNLFSYQAMLKGNLDPKTAGDISRWLALLSGMLSGVLLSALHAVVSIKYKADQIISGTVINILAIGVTGYFYRQFLAQNLPAGPGTFPYVNIPILKDIPILGPIVFQQKPLTYLMLISAVLIHYVLFYTKWGLRTRAVGEHPRAADTLGVDVHKMQYRNVWFAGILAGMGGAWFTLEAVDVFNPLMTNGLGFIGLAAMIFGKWTPFGALGAAFIFGLGSNVTSIMSIFRPDIPSHFPQMLPYLLTMIVLAGLVGRAVAPAAEGTPYEKQ